MANPAFYEFFAGGGMARAGLGAGWDCLFANDFCSMKASTYAKNWGSEHLVVEDVAKLSVDDLPMRPDMVWASFPCQDLSLAGKYAGLGDAGKAASTRSGTFWPFWSLMLDLRDQGRRPKLVVLENVVGAITSRNGKDFAALCDALASGGYNFGAVVVDARHFVPQSRPRLFLVATADDLPLPPSLVADRPGATWHSASLLTAHEALPDALRDKWVWWNLRTAPSRNSTLLDVIEDQPSGCKWHSEEETARLLAMMSPLHLAKIDQAKASGRKMVGGVYRRTRPDGTGVRRQRAEVRFDDVAGCLRTPGGGSSRQMIVVVENGNVRSRLLSPREAARLMGLPEDYMLPARYNDAYHVAGDGVCVPVVRFIASELLEPLLAGPRIDLKVA